MNKKGAIRTLYAVIITAIVCGAVASGLTYYFAKPAPKVAPEYIKIGAVCPMTGKLATWGEYLDFGYRHVITKINEKGGIYLEEYGKKVPIKYILYDDESDPERASKMVERLVTKDDVVGILGSGTPLLGGPVATAGEKFETPTLHASTPLEGHCSSLDQRD